MTKNQFRQCISFLDLNAEEEEKDALEAKYCDQNGFRYIVFLDDVTLPEAREGNFFFQKLDFHRISTFILPKFIVGYVY